ncbi:DMT family transporter [Thalassiella azotivora]
MTTGLRPSTTTSATLGLTLVTAVWGSTFFLIKDVLVVLPVLDFLAVRFVVAAAVMVVVFWRPLRALDGRAWRRGAALGVVYGVAQILQTWGLETTDASVSGFITGMYVVLTPVLGAVLLRQRTPATTWVAVALATTGLAVLSLRGLAVGTGELVTLASALVYALHIVGLGAWSTQRDALGLSTVQMLAIAAVCVAGAAPGGVVLPPDGASWAAVLYMALVAGAGALIVQTWAQAHLTATRAAIVMTTEPVFAAVFAVLLGGESLTARLLAGGSLVLLAMYVAELGPRLAARRAGRRAREPLAVEDPPSEALHHEP